MRIDVRDNFSEVQRALRQTQKDIAEKAMARALNRTAEQGNTQMVRAIAKEFNIAQAILLARYGAMQARLGDSFLEGSRPALELVA